MNIAVIGAGISGLGVAHLLSKRHRVDLYEKEARLGGHARTTTVEENGRSFGVDTGFLVFNHPTYPLLTRLFEQLHVNIERSDMSFGFWDTRSNTAYNGASLGGLFFQKKNLFSPAHYAMIRDIMRFNARAHRDLQSDAPALLESLEAYIVPYSKAFKERYLIPMGAAIWSTPAGEMGRFPAGTFLRFFKNHGLLGVSTHHQWLTVSGGSARYVEKIAQSVSGSITCNASIVAIKRDTQGVDLIFEDGSRARYDKVVLALHAPDALALLGNETSVAEREILGAFGYKHNDAVLHSDARALYPDARIWAAWNYKNGGRADAVTLSYWINRLQNLPSQTPYFVSLNETTDLEHVIERIGYEHPQFDARAIAAQSRFDQIDGAHHTHFAGAYWRNGFHEDGFFSAVRVAAKYGCTL
ncbi:MAG: FAD-dependent oxidoreductase [Campylobacterales bacterium]|nr:FAD-dependent oxidoreductase [Campylobacterales bacterium]